MSTVTLIIRLIFSLGLTIGIILLIAKIYQSKSKLTRKTIGGRTPERLVVRNRVSVSKGSSIALVDVGDKSFVVGITSQQITLLCNIDSNIGLKNEDECLASPNIGLGRFSHEDRSIDFTEHARELSTSSTIADLTSQLRANPTRTSTRKISLETILTEKISRALSLRVAR